MNTYAPNPHTVISLHHTGSMPRTKDRYFDPPFTWLPIQMISMTNIMKPISLRTRASPP